MNTTLEDMKAEFDAKVLGKRARVTEVHDLRPYDADLGCRIPISADECNQCERCGAIHPIVWTVQVDGVGEVKVGSRCALHAMGINPGSNGIKVLVAREMVLATVRAWINAAVRLEHMWCEAEMAGRRVGFDTFIDMEVAKVIAPKEGEASWKRHERISRAKRELDMAHMYVYHDARGTLTKFWTRYA